jgi:AcrR family transcriptional regulator
MAKKPSSGKGGGRKSAPQDLESRLIDGMLDLAAREGWEAVTLPAIAASAGAGLSELYPDWRSRMDVLAAFLRRIDREVVETDFAFSEQDTVRDRLFAVLMRRFDALQPHRDAVRRIRAGLMRDPFTAAAAMRRIGCSMAWMLKAAGLSVEGVAGKVKIAGVAGLWARCAAVWLNDDSEDLSRTMAELDRGLRRADRWAGIVFCRRRPSESAGTEAA